MTMGRRENARSSGWGPAYRGDLRKSGDWRQILLRAQNRAPTIDGVVNANEYPGASEIKVNPFTGVYDLGSGDDTWEIGDHGFSAWVVHDADAVYVAVDVTDDNVVTDTAEAGPETRYMGR